MTGWWSLKESLSLASLKPSRLLKTVTYSPAIMESSDDVAREMDNVSSVNNMWQMDKIDFMRYLHSTKHFPCYEQTIQSLHRDASVFPSQHIFISMPYSSGVYISLGSNLQ